jgi:hypothetical protein
MKEIGLEIESLPQQKIGLKLSLCLNGNVTNRGGHRSFAGFSGFANMALTALGRILCDSSAGVGRSSNSGGACLPTPNRFTTPFLSILKRA